MIVSRGTGGRQDLRDPRDGHGRGRPTNTVHGGQPFVPNTGGRGSSHYVVVFTAVRQRGQILLRGAVRSTRRGLRRVVLQLPLQEQMTRAAARLRGTTGINANARIFVTQDGQFAITRIAHTYLGKGSPGFFLIVLIFRLKF